MKRMNQHLMLGENVRIFEHLGSKCSQEFTSSQGTCTKWSDIIISVWECIETFLMMIFSSHLLLWRLYVSNNKWVCPFQGWLCGQPQGKMSQEKICFKLLSHGSNYKVKDGQFGYKMSFSQQSIIATIDMFKCKRREMR